MKWTGLNELREKYLEFFESKEHLRLPSYSLVPDGDKSLLLINSGMAPMKKYFTGEVTPPKKRVTTCQKCIRTPDIERVGITARHGTYFEMLGNFSFGDYFKRQAIEWAWEFFTKTLELPVELLHCSVYQDDDEAYDIWNKEIGVDTKHITKLGKADNFWEHGAGPCGPCSEIYFDRGEKYGCGEPTCGVGCECDRYVEVWNLVFTQFESDGKGTYTPLANPNIDTGMGLERLACVMQGVDNLFLVDTMQKIMDHISKIAGKKYGENDSTDISLRVITDHVRSTTFMIGDGVMPSNEGRGYVLRRLLRRAVRHGILLGVKEPFLSEVAKTVIEENRTAYPELAEKIDTITKIIHFEEESFYSTIDQGLELLNQFIDKMDSKVFSGADAFKLNDTFGFPIDLTKEILKEKGIEVDEDRYKSLLLEQREKARNARKNAGADAWKTDNSVFDGISATQFIGYDNLECESNLLAVIKDGAKVNSAEIGDEIIIVTDVTPCYAESGGQVGDRATVEAPTFKADIVDTVKNPNGIYIHRAVVTDGTVMAGGKITLTVDKIGRMGIMRNHTAAHLLQAALKQVLGNHVEQAGQLVDAKRVRFDFTHFSALTKEELMAVEMTVNTQIMNALNVDCKEMPIDEAKKIGATALFGEKYGDTVRVVAVDEFSKEFCGGTHVDNTAKIALLKIVSESSVAAGVRRIEAVTGMNVYQMLNNSIEAINQTAVNLKVNQPSELVAKSALIMADMKEKDREIESLRSQIASGNVNRFIERAQDVNGVKVISMYMAGLDATQLRSMCDKVKDLAIPEPLVAVIAGSTGDKAQIVCACNKLAMEKGLKAGNIVKAVAQVTGGNGGGKPDFAMAGAKDITKLDEAIAQVKDILTDLLKG